MIVKDEQGREIELTLGGCNEDDIQIELINYVDSDEGVSEETIEYIYQTYADEMFEHWVDTMIGASADFNDYLSEGDDNGIID